MGECLRACKLRRWRRLLAVLPALDNEFEQQYTSGQKATDSPGPWRELSCRSDCLCCNTQIVNTHSNKLVLLCMITYIKPCCLAKRCVRARNCANISMTCNSWRDLGGLGCWARDSDASLQATEDEVSTSKCSKRAAYFVHVAATACAVLRMPLCGRRKAAALTSMAALLMSLPGLARARGCAASAAKAWTICALGAHWRATLSMLDLQSFLAAAALHLRFALLLVQPEGVLACWLDSLVVSSVCPPIVMILVYGAAC